MSRGSQQGQDSLGTSLHAKATWYPEDSKRDDVWGRSRTYLWAEVTWCLMKDVPRLSWDVPHGILRTPSHTSLQGCPRTILGRPSWDPPDTKSHLYTGMSKDCPGTSLMGFPRGVPAYDHPLCSGQSQTFHYVWTALGTYPTFAGNTGHPSREGQSIMFPFLLTCD